MMVPAALFECRHVVECIAHPHPNHPDAVFRDDKLSCFDWICKVSLALFWRLNLLFRTLTALKKRCAHLPIINNICHFFLLVLCCHDQMLLKKTSATKIVQLQNPFQLALVVLADRHQQIGRIRWRQIWKIEFDPGGGVHALVETMRMNM